MFRAALCGLALLLPFVVWSYGGLWEYLTNNNLACLSLAFAALLYGRKSFSLRDALPLLCLLFYLFSLLSASPADNLWQLLFVFSLALNLFSGEEGSSRSVFARVLLLACLFNAIVSLFQYFGQAELGGIFFFQSPPGAIVGNLRQTNNLGTLMVIGVAMLAGMDETEHKCSRRRYVLIAMALLFAFVAAITTSRTALVTILGVSVTGLFLLRRKVVLLAALVGTLLFNCWLSYSGGMSAVMRLTAETLSCGGRRAIWSDGLEMVFSRPWTGWGWGSLRYAQVVLGGEERLHSCFPLGELHNEVLQITATLGIPFLCLLLGLLLSGAVWIYRRYKPEKAVYVLVMLPLLLHSMLEYPLHRPVFLMILAFSLAGLMAGELSALKRWPWRGARALPSVFWVLVMALFVSAEMSSRSLVEKNSEQLSAPITTTEQFFHPREALLFILYSSPVDGLTAGMLLDYEEILLKSILSVQLLEKLQQAAEILGDTEKTERFRRMIRYETEWLARAAERP